MTALSVEQTKDWIVARGGSLPAPVPHFPPPISHFQISISHLMPSASNTIFYVNLAL